MVLQELKEFCTETSIHGPSHIVNAQNSILKRLLWFAIFVGCLAYAGQKLVNDNIKGKVIETKKGIYKLETQLIIYFKNNLVKAIIL